MKWTEFVRREKDGGRENGGSWPVWIKELAMLVNASIKKFGGYVIRSFGLLPGNTGTRPLFLFTFFNKHSLTLFHSY